MEALSFRHFCRLTHEIVLDGLLGPEKGDEVANFLIGQRGMEGNAAYHGPADHLGLRQRPQPLAELDRLVYVSVCRQVGSYLP